MTGIVSRISNWLDNFFSDPEVVILFFFLFSGVLVIMYLGSILAPVLASIVIAYLLNWIVKGLQRLKCPYKLAVIASYTLFVGSLIVLIFGLLPLIWEQASALLKELPDTLSQAQSVIMMLPQKFPEYVSQAQLNKWVSEFNANLGQLGHYVLSASLATIPSLISMVIYLVLVPLLVYFFLMDKDNILAWASGLLPKRRGLSLQVWTQVNSQMGRYIGGKVLEIFIVALTAYLAFVFFGLNYALLLASIVGLSVLIPFVGVVIVTLPVAIVALMQWGWGSQFAYLMAVYAIIMAVDGNIIVPILFSEALNIHPVAIILAILLFGAIWGFWGVFFAIPLATLVRAVINEWPASA